jgi:ADP-ribose pyrophosphatase YjhB (NUDIX family)
MSTDNWTPGAVDLVIFTVADPSTMPSLIWDKSMVSFGESNPEAHTGLSLFVLTVAAPTDLDKYFPGRRILPGGHLQWDETLLEASRRIADDRLGIDFKKIRARLRQLGTFDDPERDPRGRALSFAYWSIVNFEDVRKYLGGRDQVGLELVNSQHYMDQFIEHFGPLEQYDGVSRFGCRTMPSPSMKTGHKKTLTKSMPSGPILAQDHDDMVFYAWRALRHAFDARLDPFSYLGLNPISEEFRLSDLQELTEVCRGERVQRDLFRRNVKNLDFLAASGNFDRSRPGKPATMYYSPLALDQNSDKKDSSD